MDEKKNCACEYHNLEQGDTLYVFTSWDGGVGYEYIDNIKFCPVCGKELPPEAHRLRRLYKRTEE